MADMAHGLPGTCQLSSYHYSCYQHHLLLCNKLNDRYVLICWHFGNHCRLSRNKIRESL